MKINDLKRLIEKERNLIIIAFYGKWHSQCGSTLSSYNSKSIMHNCIFLKLNTEDPENKEAVYMFKINVIPTFIFISNISEIDRIEGSNNSQFSSLLKKYSNGIKFRKRIQRKHFEESKTNNLELLKVSSQIKKVRFNVNEIYFERQKEALCGLHAINNALQVGLVTKTELFTSAINLKIELDKLLFQENLDNENPYFNEYGNFNLDVLEISLKRRGIVLKRVFFNSMTDIPIGMFICCNGYHWFSIRKFDFDLPIWRIDSLLNEPVIIKNFGEIIVDYRNHFFELIIENLNL